MSQLTVSVPHELGQAEAIRKLQDFILRNATASEIRDLAHEWQANQLRFAFKAMGFATSGQLLVHDEDVNVVTEIPLAATLFQSRIEQEIRQQLATILAAG